MTMISVLILHWIGVITIDTSGSVGQLTVKAAGAAAFVIVFMILLVQLLKQIPRTRILTARIQEFLE